MVFNSRFQHITEKIFRKLDIKTLKNTRLVSKSWREYMDNQKVLWKNVNGTKVFQLACEKGHTKMAEILIQNSVKFNIDLNVKYGYFEKTAFQTACHYGCSEVVEIIVKKSTEFNIDLNSKDKEGMTGFHLACRNDYSKIAKIMVMKSNL